ncbi:sigma factor-like helix-turn-helix DNA-binding protein [Streptomyces sp. NPDC005925]|uniref:sigma factor-like helix-turn-helix DNA-binding protein n=1 Tax=Streptomyces sp. NPDC005925 TaxID=3157172 RepID=UPI0033FB679A
MHIPPAAGATPAAVRPSGPARDPRLRSARTPEEAFDALYAHAAPAIVHQTYLLTGDRGRAFESTEHAFHQAWDHWPEIAVDSDPVGWVRAQAHEYALSPWHRLRRAPRRRTGQAPTDPLVAALLALPPRWRRTVLLCEGLGMSVAQAAAETAASTHAARSRLRLGRAAVAEYVPEIRDPQELGRRLATLVSTVSTATLPNARSVRAGSEERMRTLTRTVFGATAALVGLIVFTAATASPWCGPSVPSAPNRAVTTAQPDTPRPSTTP